MADRSLGMPKLYRELADWWPLLSAPPDYAEEAAFYQQSLLAAAVRPVESLLELGCGGGNDASHLKARFRMTLTDRSPAMLAVSRRLNPECEHVEGDMRTIRLGRTFDAVFVHDAVAYLTSEAVRVEWDRHVEGLFARQQWLTWLTDAGFDPDIVVFDHSELEPGTYEIFVCRKPE